MTRPPAYQPKLKELTPRLARLFKERGWIDRRTVQLKPKTGQPRLAEV